VLGVLLSLKHELRVMTAQKSGSIVNISSTYGHQGAAGASVYVGSKHAVEGITKSAALEGAVSGVRVNAVAPGPTDTGMLDRFTGNPQNKAALASTVPLGRVGKPASRAPVEHRLQNSGVLAVKRLPTYRSISSTDRDAGYTLRVLRGSVLDRLSPRERSDALPVLRQNRVRLAWRTSALF